MIIIYGRRKLKSIGSNIGWENIHLAYMKSHQKAMQLDKALGVRIANPLRPILWQFSSTYFTPDGDYVLEKNVIR